MHIAHSITRKIERRPACREEARVTAGRFRLAAVRGVLVALSVAGAVPSAAQAQTADDAGRFFDKVVTDTVPDFTGISRRKANQSVTQSCKTVITGTLYNASATIDWAKVLVHRIDGTKVSLTGGGYVQEYIGSSIDSERSGKSNLTISFSDPDIAQRVDRAVAVLIKSCAASAGGF